MDNVYLTRLQIIAEDLATLEINTMVIPGLTARKMPDVPKALDEIADCYEQTLIEIDPGFSNGGGIGKVIDRFTAIEVEARKAVRALEVINGKSARDKLRFIIAQRIKSNSGEITGILKEYAGAKNIDPSSITFDKDLPKPLASQNQLRIRRIWDIATEEVVMQTLVQLNGDVVTRVTELYASDDYRVLHKVHADSVMLSLDMWKELIATLAAFFTQLLDRFKNRRTLLNPLRFRQDAAQLLTGGLVVRSPAGAAEGAVLFAETVIQPNGDIVVKVNPEKLDATAWQTHSDQVALVMKRYRTGMRWLRLLMHWGGVVLSLPAFLSLSARRWIVSLSLFAVPIVFSFGIRFALKRWVKRLIFG